MLTSSQLLLEIKNIKKGNRVRFFFWKLSEIINSRSRKLFLLAVMLISYYINIIRRDCYFSY